MTEPCPLQQALAQSLATVDSDARLHIGYSGGLDSTVLLHALAATAGPDRLVAVHVNHQLHPQADAWQRHCQQTARALGCAFEGLRVTIDAHTGSGLESAARAARYRAFDACVPEQGTLWLAHHLDDQVETLILRMLRGTGLAGLAGMAATREQAHYRLMRPWLGIRRQALQAFASARGLTWIDDDSNADDRFDRNYLRHRVLPLLEGRWPGYRDTLERSRQHIAAAAGREQCRWQAAVATRMQADGSLSLANLQPWPDSDLDSLLHTWLQPLCKQVPSMRRVQQIRQSVVGARADANPQVALPGGSVRRYQHALHWVPTLPPIGEPPSVRPDQWQDWPGLGAVMLRSKATGAGRIRAALTDLSWRLRQGGEVFWPAGRARRRDLKRLLAEYRVPPWRRDRLPLLYCGDTLIAIADRWIDARYAAREGEPGFEVQLSLKDSD
ncbi:MAG: tRNA lysidine(34) synthetase TilS [Saccharospirillum sp.]